MSNRPDLDEAIDILLAGGWNITGGIYAPKDKEIDNDKEELRQKLASIEHERWADWQKWCHKVLREQVPYSPELELVLTRWDKQIETPYSGLSDKEKASDMEQVDRYWHLIDQYTQSKLKLLDEVREQVIGEDEDTRKWEDPIDRQVASECNQLRAEQRARLTKLEAEL